MQINIHRPNKKIVFGVLLGFFIVSTCVLGYFIFTLNNKLQDKKSEVASLNRQVTTLTNVVKEISDQKDFVANIGSFMTDKVGELDDLITANDEDALDLIRWVGANAYYYGDDLQTANFKIGQFISSHEQTLKDYDKIVNEITEFSDNISNENSKVL